MSVTDFWPSDHPTNTKNGRVLSISISTLLNKHCLLNRALLEKLVKAIWYFSTICNKNGSNEDKAVWEGGSWCALNGGISNLAPSCCYNGQCLGGLGSAFTGLNCHSKPRKFWDIFSLVLVWLRTSFFSVASASLCSKYILNLYWTPCLSLSINHNHLVSPWIKSQTILLSPTLNPSKHRRPPPRSR